MRRTKIEPGEDLGGGASRALWRAAPDAADNCRAARCGMKVGFCEYSGANGAAGVMAASRPRIWQHEAFNPKPHRGQSGAMPRQHAGRVMGWEESTSAHAGIAVQRTATISSHSAPFLLRIKLESSQRPLYASGGGPRR